MQKIKQHKNQMYEMNGTRKQKPGTSANAHNPYWAQQ